MQCIFGLHITRQIETWSIHKCGVVPTLYLRAPCARVVGTERGRGDFGRSVYSILIEGGRADYAPKNYFPQIFRPSYGLACMHKSYIYVGGFIAENSSQISKGVLALFSFNPIYSGHYFRPICWVWVKNKIKVTAILKLAELKQLWKLSKYKKLAINYPEIIRKTTPQKRTINQIKQHT